MKFLFLVISFSSYFQHSVLLSFFLIIKSPAPLYTSFSTPNFPLHIYLLFPVNQKLTSKLPLFSLKTLFYTDRSQISYHHNCSWDFFQSSQNHMLNDFISFPKGISYTFNCSQSLTWTPFLCLCKHFLTSTWKKLARSLRMTRFSQAIKGSRHYWMQPGVSLTVKTNTTVKYVNYICNM